MEASSPNVSIDVASSEMISTPSTSPEPIEAKENESPTMTACGQHKTNPLHKSEYELSTESLLSSPTQMLASHPKSNFPISSLISGGMSVRSHSSEFVNAPSLMSSMRHPFYLPNQSGMSFFDRNPFLREFAIPPHFVPPFSTIKTSLFNAFASTDK